MRSIYLKAYPWVLAAFVLFACRALSIAPAGQPAAPPSWPGESTQIATSTPSPQPDITLAIGQPDTPNPAPQVEQPALQLEGGFEVRMHPDDGLVVGDQVSIEVIAPERADLSQSSLFLQVDDQELGPYPFEYFGIGGRLQATLLWAWDTSNLGPGWRLMTFSIRPGGPTWQEPVWLAPQAGLSEMGGKGSWVEAESDCCTLYTITGSDAERDIEHLTQMADRAAQRASNGMQASFDKPIPVVFLPRVLGHGGFASQEIAVSYLDRNYAGGDQEIVLLHEMVHILDSQLGGDLRPAMLVEGLAVYISGGHYKGEALLPRAAAAIHLGSYIPLNELADNFYPSQHETGYLQAGALVQYMVDRWGWQSYNQFYRQIQSGSPAGKPSRAIDAALTLHFGISLARLEQDFKAAMHEQTVTPEIMQDVSLTVWYYDTLRRYQQLLDTSAYYLTAWLPNSQQMRERGITADYLRHPGAAENMLVEELLIQANRLLVAGQYPEVERLLQTIDETLDTLQRARSTELEAR